MTTATYHPRGFLWEPVIDRGQAEGFLLRLHDEGLLFHLEDPPEEVIRLVDGVEVRVFTDNEAPAVRARLDELYALDWSDHGGCPINFVADRVMRNGCR